MLPLHEAAQSGDLASVQHALDTGCNINERNQNGRTPLMLAAWFVHPHIVSFLLSHQQGVAINTFGNDGYNALHLAVQSNHGNSQVIQLLLDAGCQPDVVSRNEYKATALHLACMFSIAANVKSLIQAGADLHHINIYEETVLMSAARHKSDNSRTIKLLVDAGVSVNAVSQNEYKTTALHLACELSVSATVEALIQAGADLHHISGVGETVLMSAAQNKSDNSQTIQLLVDAGVSVNAVSQDKYKITALHLACELSVLATVEALIQAGADLHHVSRNGHTALMAAARHASDNSHTIQLLVDAGLSVNAVSENEWKTTALHLASEVSVTSNVESLVRLGAHVNKEDGKDWTPLGYAASKGDPAMIKLLVSHHAEVNQSDRHVPLIQAVHSNKRGNVKALLKSGAYVNQVDEDGNSALHVACEKGLGRCVLVLLKYGADVTIMNGDGRLPVDLADGEDKEVIVKALTNASIASGRRDSDSLSSKHTSSSHPLLEACRQGNAAEVKKLLSSFDANVQDELGNTALHICCKLNYIKCAQVLVKASANVGIKNKNGQLPVDLLMVPNSEMQKLLSKQPSTSKKGMFGKVKALFTGKSSEGATTVSSSSKSKLSVEIQSGEDTSGAAVTIGNYMVKAGQDSFIGRGSFSTIFIATDTRTGEKAAAKRINLLGLSNTGITEGETLPFDKNLKHTNVVALFEVKTIGSDLWIIMDKCDYDLHQVIEKDTIITLDECICKSCLIQAADGLSYLHHNKIIHRDLKANNILVTERKPFPLLKLTDFSFAKDLEGKDSYMSTVRGNTHWMAPELLTSGGHHNKQAFFKSPVDVFSMGLVYLFICADKSGIEVFKDTQIGVEVKLGNHPLDLFNGHWRAGVMDSQLAGLLQQMLARDHYARPTAATVASQLRDMYPAVVEQLD